MIPYSTQDISDADVKAVGKALISGWLTQGPAVERFEKALAKAAGTKYAVAVNSGTAALHAAYFAAGIGKGDEVIVPALTFAATANAALYLGAKPVFADVDPATGNMSIADAKKKITKKTKAIVPVDYAGRPAELGAFKKLARKHGLVLIADAAQSLGSLYRGSPAASVAGMSIFSFHPVKSITTGEGGAIVTDNKKFADLMRIFRTHGITKDRVLLQKKHEGGWYMEQQYLGFNYRMSDINAALGESQMKRLKTFIAKRRAAALRYDKLLKNIQGLALPPKEHGVRSAWHLYPVRVPAEKHRVVFDYLRARGIGVQVHHIPVHTHPFFKKLGYKKGSCPVAEEFYATAISIPIFAKITPQQQMFVTKILKKALA